MKKLPFKKAVLEQAGQYFRSAMEDLEKEIARYREVDERTLDEGQSDISQQAQDDANQEIINELLRQIEYLKEKQARLGLLDTAEELMDFVGPGSVVQVEENYYFIGAGFEPLPVNGTQVAGLELEAAFYEAMRDKKAGERFAFRGKNHRIEEVF